MVGAQKPKFPDFEDVRAPFRILFTGRLTIGLKLLNAEYEVWEAILRVTKISQTKSGHKRVRFGYTGDSSVIYICSIIYMPGHVDFSKFQNRNRSFLAHFYIYMPGNITIFGLIVTLI